MRFRMNRGKIVCDLVFSLQEFLKILPGIVIFPFSLYFVWKKLSNRVTASITTHYQRTIAPRISEVVLANLKDGPLAIFAIYALLDKDIYIELDRFDPPLILKPLETLKIATDPYSQLIIGNDRFEPDFTRSKIDIYLVLSDKIIKCIQAGHPNLQSLPVLLNHRYAIKETKKFNNIVYNEFAAYAITYRINAKIETTIVDKAGHIGGDWAFPFNAIPVDVMGSKEDVKQFLEKTIFGKLTDSFSVDALQ